MGNVLRLNSLFELELVSYPDKLQIHPGIRDKAFSMEYLFWILCGKNDYLYLSKPDDKFNDYLSNRLNKSVKILNTFPVHNYSGFIEWGRYHNLNPNGYLEMDIELILQSRKLNSKVLQNQFLFREKNFYSISEFPDTQSIKNFSNFPILFKPEISFSGIGHKFFKSREELSFFINSKPIKNGVIQSLKNRKIDFSILFEKVGKELNPICFTIMNISDRNNYRGTILESDFFLNSPSKVSSKESSRIKFLIDYDTPRKAIESITNFLNYIGIIYEGPIAIDGFIYLENDKEKIAFSEINFRYSMGRILYELSKIFKEPRKHFLFSESLKHFTNLNIKEIEDKYREKYSCDTVILLTPPFVDGKKVSSVIIYGNT